MPHKRIKQKMLNTPPMNINDNIIHDIRLQTLMTCW